MGSLCGIAFYYHMKKSETSEPYTVLSATVKDKYINDTEYFYDNGRLLRVQFGDIDGRKADGDIKIHHDAGLQ